MNRRVAVVAVAAAVSFVVLAGSARAQTRKTGTTTDPYPRIVEGTFGIGYTALSLEPWTGYSESSLMDWNKLNYQFSALVLPAQVAQGKFAVGGEVGYQYYMWYTYHPYYQAYYTADVTAMRFLAMARTEVRPGVFADFGAGLYHFSEGTDFGFAGAVGYALRINQRMSVPIKGRLDYLIDSAGNVAVFSVVGGISYKF